MMVAEKIKNFIRKYPGYMLVFSVGQLILSIVFLGVIFCSCRSLQLIRSSGEVRAEADFVSVVHQMELTAADQRISDSQKKLVFYGKSLAAAEALAGTGYGEELKRSVTETLNGISRHMLEGSAPEELLTSDELSFIRLFGELGTEEAYGIFFEQRKNILSSEDEVSDIGAGRKPLIKEQHTGKKAAEKAANQLFGVRSVLTEKKGPAEGTLLFSCKNAYAVMKAEENYPLEAAIFLPWEEGERYTAEECFVLAKSILESAYPRRIYRHLLPVTETDGDGACEVVFGDGEGMSVTVRVSKANGKLLSLRLESAEQEKA